LPDSDSTLKGASSEELVLDITKDIQSLTTFRRRSGDFMKQIKKSKRAVVLTVNGKAAAVVQDAEAYQRLLDAAARADARKAVRQGMEDARKGVRRTKTDAAERLASFGKRNKLSLRGLKLRDLINRGRP
jgi:prevent-host-death family protein